MGQMWLFGTHLSGDHMLVPWCVCVCVCVCETFSAACFVAFIVCVCDM